jgi:hypothetical protein
LRKEKVSKYYFVYCLEVLIYGNNLLNFFYIKRINNFHVSLQKEFLIFLICVPVMFFTVKHAHLLKAENNVQTLGKNNWKKSPQTKMLF